MKTIRTQEEDKFVFAMAETGGVCDKDRQGYFMHAHTQEDLIFILRHTTIPVQIEPKLFSRGYRVRPEAWEKPMTNAIVLIYVLGILAVILAKLVWNADPGTSMARELFGYTIAMAYTTVCSIWYTRTKKK